MQPRRKMALLFVGLTGIAGPAITYASETITYTYDSRGRLVKTLRTGTVNNNVKTEYKYDRADNRTKVTVTLPNPPP